MIQVLLHVLVTAGVVKALGLWRLFEISLFYCTQICKFKDQAIFKPVRKTNELFGLDSQSKNNEKLFYYLIKSVHLHRESKSKPMIIKTIDLTSLILTEIGGRITYAVLVRVPILFAASDYRT